MLPGTGVRAGAAATPLKISLGGVVAHSQWSSRSDAKPMNTDNDTNLKDVDLVRHGRVNLPIGNTNEIAPELRSFHFPRRPQTFRGTYVERAWDSTYLRPVQADFIDKLFQSHSGPFVAAKNYILDVCQGMKDIFGCQVNRAK